ncbi:F-box domain [Macleaya cordata]|uniref:F-box domain n=1 Tax=Macleaya cordata TaxID=56857 RepID=A0A200QKN1_MACCD|nr:F-box domain [Macleaya cordata]
MGGIKKKNYYFFLPEEIIMEILSRLPVKSILLCRLVCKTWRSLIYNPSFAHMHLLRRGLDDDHEFVYICNPITRECVNLPSVIKQSSNSSRMDIVCGFGYIPSTNEYKVVRIYYCRGKESYVGRVQVYTLGNGTGWRDKGEITYSLISYRPFPAILANGALHWLDDEGKIVAFDLADEEFLLLPSPPCFLLQKEDEYPFQLQVLGGWLCVVHCKNKVSVDVWLLKKKKKKKETNGNYNIKGKKEYQFWSWIKEFDIDSDFKARYPMPLSLTKHGEVLFYSHAAFSLSRYDLKTATSEKLVDVKKYVPACFSFQAIPHSNSFVSLKALGEEDTKIIESAS